MTTGSTDLRSDLRDRTRPEHTLTEAAFSRFNISTAEGFAGFLRAHDCALNWLTCCFDKRNPYAVDLSALRQKISADLQALGFSRSRHRLMLDGPGHPVGASYVLAGSNLGNQLQLDQLRSSNPALAETASAYLSGADLKPVWKRLVIDLKAGVWSSDSSEIIDAAKNTFSAYRAAAKLVD